MVLVRVSIFSSFFVFAVFAKRRQRSVDAMEAAAVRICCGVGGLGGRILSFNFLNLFD